MSKRAIETEETGVVKKAKNEIEKQADESQESVIYFKEKLLSSNIYKHAIKIKGDSDLKENVAEELDEVSDEDGSEKKTNEEADKVDKKKETKPVEPKYSVVEPKKEEEKGGESKEAPVTANLPVSIKITTKDE